MTGIPPKQRPNQRHPRILPLGKKSPRKH